MKLLLPLLSRPLFSIFHSARPISSFSSSVTPLSPVLLFLFTLPPAPFGIQRRCLSQGKSLSGACAWSGASCLRPPLFRTPLLPGWGGRTCPVGGDTQAKKGLCWQISYLITDLKIFACGFKKSFWLNIYFYYGKYLIEFLLLIFEVLPLVGGWCCFWHRGWGLGRLPCEAGSARLHHPHPLDNKKERFVTTVSKVLSFQTNTQTKIDTFAGSDFTQEAIGVGRSPLSQYRQNHVAPEQKFPHHTVSTAVLSFTSWAGPQRELL